MFIREVYNSGTQTITSGTLPLAPVKCNAYGHINSLFVDISVTTNDGTSGVVITTNTVDQVINRLTIRDKNSKPILDCLGSQLEKAIFVLSCRDGYNWGTLRKGQYTAATALSDASDVTAQTNRRQIPFGVTVTDQPISVELTFDVLATLFSTIGTGTPATATAAVTIATENIQQALPNAETQRIYAFTAPAAITSETDYSYALPRTVTIDTIAVDMTTDAQLTDLTLKPKGGNVGLDRVKQKYWNMWDTFMFVSGHLAGFFIPNIAPFVVNDSTVFSVNPASSTTPVFYICHRGVR